MVFFLLMAIFGTAVVKCVYLFISKCFECSQSSEMKKYGASWPVLVYFKNGE